MCSSDLAILVIIALPNVICMYNRAQKQMFLTEAKKVYSEAEKKYLTNAISGKNTKVINSEDSSKLDMTGKKLQYCVVLNSSGNVTDMKVSNGKWVASLNGKTIEDLTVDDLKEGNLDDYECGEAPTDESCFTYASASKSVDNATLTFTIGDVNKCKKYLISKNTPEDAATSLCNGGTYTLNDQDITIYDLFAHGFSKDNYAAAGLNVKYIIIEKVEVVDITKCKNYLQSKFGFDEDDLTTLCTTNESVDGKNLFQAVSEGYISFSTYDKAGLKVTSKDLTTEVSITGYNTGCGTDVVIPSKINGYNVISIGSYAFLPCYIPLPQNSEMGDEYKVKFLNFKMNDEYNIQKVGAIGCVDGTLTSVVLPNTLVYIGDYAFAYNSLSDVTIPSSVKYIGSYSFKSNNIKTVTYNGNESNITFGDCPYYGNYDYSGRYKNCRPE